MVKNIQHERILMKKIAIFATCLLIGSAGAIWAADAAANWSANCAQCHGKTGSADTPMGKKLNAKNRTDAKVQAGFTDAQAADAIKNGMKENGKTLMKAFGDKFSDADVKALVAYVRTLKK